MAVGAATSAGLASGTIDELLSTAERLFAREGVANVPLTQIVAQAGQKNRSALHYHFGSRAGVLTAVMNRRLEAINARREALIDALPPSPAPTDVLRADILPLAQVAFAEPWGADYLSILAQISFHPQLLGEGDIEARLLTGLRRGRALLNRATPHLTPEMLDRRVGWFKDSVVFALARWVRDTPASQRTAAGLDDLVDQLVAYGAAGLTAPALPSPNPQKVSP